MALPAILNAVQNLVSGAGRMDGWKNVLTNLGVAGKDARLETRYSGRDPLTRGELETMYEQDDIFPLIVDRIPEHGTRRWIRIVGAMEDSGRPDVDFSRQAAEALEALDAQQKFYEMWRLHRLYGGSAALIGADDGRKPSEPLLLENVKEVRYLNVLSRWEIFPGPLNRDPTSDNFRKPDYYTLTGGAGLDQIHHTRVLRFERTMVASEMSPRGIDGWDLPVGDRVYEPLRQFGSLLGYAEATFQDLSQGVVTMKGLAAALSAQNGDELVINRLQTMSLVRSALNMIILDEDEKYERRTQTPTGLNEMVIRAMDRLAAASEMPLSILFGQPPTGLSTDDASGRRAFYDAVSTKQRRVLRKPLNWLTDVVVAAKKGPTKGRAPEKWSIEFLPLEEPSENDSADRAMKQAATEEKLIDIQVLTAQEVRSRYVNDTQSPYQLDLETDDAEVELDESGVPIGEAEKMAAELGMERGAPVDPETGGTVGEIMKTTLEVIASVAAREYPRDTGIELLVMAGLTPEKAEAVMGDVGDVFFSKPDPTLTPPVVFGPPGGAPVAPGEGHEAQPSTPGEKPAEEFEQPEPEPDELTSKDT